MTNDHLFEGLNPQQLQAVRQTDGPLLILAGAGSGKTRVLTYRIAYLIQQGLAKPHEILAVTFTNKAASEMKQRIERLLNFPVAHLWIGTFHSISARILHYEAKYVGYQSNFTIYDADDQLNQIKRIMQFLNINKDILSPRTVQYAISQAKNKLRDASQFAKEAHEHKERQIARVFADYEITLRRNNALDFDDLLIKPIDIFTAHREVLEKYQQKFKYILVDEYQDTNKAQYHWVRLLSEQHRNLCVVGDEDQSIYRWRGADIENILSFEKDFKESTVIRLEQNYRSTQTILDAANQVVRNNTQRLGKNLWSDKGLGAKIQVYNARDERHEGEILCEMIRNNMQSENGHSLNDMVTLYRTNAQSRALEEQLRRKNIPYTIVGGTKFYERKEIKDILAYLRILVNPSDSLSLMRIINFPARGIGNVSQDALMMHANNKSAPVMEVLSNPDEIDGLTDSARKKMSAFYKQVRQFTEKADKTDAAELMREVIEHFNLRSIYEHSDLIEDEARLENINELVNSVEQFVVDNPENNFLANYLDEISLVTDVDRWDPDKPSVTLMTLHSVKGLEFPVVFITGLEDGLFPLARTFNDPDDLEEERRLFYVGLTRAEEKVYLLNAQTRHRFTAGEFGQSFVSIPSRFIREIPNQYVETHETNQYGGYRATQKDRMKQMYRKKQAMLSTNPLSDENSEFKIGQYVSHETFGKGQVLGVDSSSMGTKLTIQFANRQLKKLIAEYANLTHCED